MITDRFLTEMPFSDVAEIEILYNNERNNAYHYVYDMFTNNDCLMALDPDHNTFENCTVKKCSNYDTSLVFNKTFCCQNNISILHLNICSSQHKLTDITYYLEHFNVTFSFMGINETSATQVNNHISFQDIIMNNVSNKLIKKEQGLAYI